MTEFDFYKGLVQVITQLTSAVTNTRLYSHTHPQVAGYVEKAYRGLIDLLGLRKEVTILLIGDDVVVDNKQLQSSGPYVYKFMRILKEKAIQRMTFVSGLAKPELQGLIQELASTDSTSVHSTVYIKLGKVELRLKKVSRETAIEPITSDGGQEELQAIIEAKGLDLDKVEELYHDMKRHKEIEAHSVDDIVKDFVRSFRRDVNPISLLAKLKSSDEYTFTHAVNVGILTMSQAKAMGFAGKYLHQIGTASILHDMGKLYVPDEILNKEGMLTDKERSIIETHSVKGARYLIGLGGIPKLAVLASLEHHIRYDGTGYPSIKGGWRPNIVSQIIAISDVFDAMRTNRSYRGATPQQEIEDVLNKGKGKSFNPQLVDLFLSLIKR